LHLKLCLANSFQKVSSSMLLRLLSSTAVAAGLFCIVSTPAALAQGGKPLLSPAATASVTLAGKTVMIHYNQPSLRGRQLGGPEIVPWNKVWRTGANPATSLMTPVPLHIGALLVPAGSYTIYTLPNPGKWMLIVNKQTGQWGTVYNMDQDLGRTPMKNQTLPGSQEVMTISFDDIKRDSAELHLRWGTVDESVKVSTP
jgi:hypothetical protein